MLKIKKLTAVIDEENILDEITLEVNKGEIHAIIGPEGAGKTFLSHIILGNPNLTVKSGSLTFNKKSILEKSIEERNLLGIFSSFQYPPAMTGISNFAFLEHALTARKDKRTLNEVALEYKLLCKKLGLSSDHGKKDVNHMIMTPAECKKNELIHMLMLNPSLIVLDEIDAEVEEDEVELIGAVIKEFLSDGSKAAIIITRRHEILDILTPTRVHVMVAGEIKVSGPTELYKRIVTDGYSQFS